MKTSAAVCLCIAFLELSAVARANTAAAAKGARAECITADFRARHLENREMKFDVILPRDYATSARRFPVLYLLHGYGGNYKDWCSLTHIADYAKHYEEIIIMPGAANSWYVNNYANPQLKWEDYITADLIPYVDSHYRTLAARQHRAIAGLSMGGYGALFLALKHPQMFAAAASLSGVVASANMDRWDRPLVQAQQKNPAYAALIRSMRLDFGPTENPARAGEDLFLLVRKVMPANCPQLYLSIGWGDTLLHENREFVRLLARLKMPYRYSEVPGKHEWPVWNEQVRCVLALQAPVIGAPRIPLGNESPNR